VEGLIFLGLLVAFLVLIGWSGILGGR